MLKTLRCALDCRAFLGEGPTWDPQGQALWWCDIYGPTLERWVPESGDRRSWTLPEPVGSFALCESGDQAVVALADGFHVLNLGSGTLTPIVDPDPERPGTRFNDGRCDRQGRFLAGTMSIGLKRSNAALYRLDAELDTTRLFGDATVANGLAFSPDGATMYWADSPAQTIWAFEYDAARGVPGERRVLRSFGPGDGYPDGAAVDAEGCYWTAMFAGGRVLRLHPQTGEILREIAIPVRRPTMPAFGGADLRTLYVTSAREHASAAELAHHPQSGSIFAIEVDVPGLVEPRFKG
ncbi:MAG: SMP-30/gluconolactonase/LRE family protein [Phreatobacter sp.]|uniref:SMP-30/gluconolactonase/LRE family protein n=1 Tax=Phreatobacter sp. TaxID=1966341 RepID=UPI001A5F420D|nr:SMP-30/gluconolactonase/LRE family protein [Phreatobacter sp.]MBL8571855.1 SMP-30/gluconolactonase/LRE family protein [Phreatobacter sp.]